MPGNEAGDRIHNFFAEDNLSHSQQHTRGIESTWPMPGNHPWAGSPRQIGAHIFSNIKNTSAQQPVDSGRVHGDQVSTVQHGLNFSRSNLGSEFSRSQSQSQQPSSNGYMHGRQVFQTRQNGSTMSAVESDSHNATSQLANGLEFESNSVRMNFPESPVSYDFLGGQQQLSTQIPSMLQALQRQQSGVNDMQLQQQELMLKQIQEFQRQQHHLEKQQLQHQEPRSLSSMNHVNSFSKHAAFGHSTAMINGFPVQDGSNYHQQHEVMASNRNWRQRSLSPVVQGSFSGQIFSPEQVQIPRSIGMVPQQFDQSLYGVPISGTRVSLHQIPSTQIDKPIIQETAGCNSFPGSQFTGFPSQIAVQDESLVSRGEYQGKGMIGTSDCQGFNVGFNLRMFQQDNTQHSNESMQEFHGRQETVCPSETLQENPVLQVTPLQNVATLDPTEEKILFGSDDNLWDTFAKETDGGSGGYNIMDSPAILGTLPSIQSGSWSALMQSAVAETSSSDLAPQEAWSGLTFQNSKPPAGNHQTLNDSRRQHSAWVDNSLPSSAQNLRTYPPSEEINGSMNYSVTGVQQTESNTSHQWAEQLQTGSPQRSIQQFPGVGGQHLDGRPLQKPVPEGTRVCGKVSPSPYGESVAKSSSGYWTDEQSMPSYDTGGQQCSRQNGWAFIDPVSSSTYPDLKTHGNQNSFQSSQRADQNSESLEEASRSAGIWKVNSIANSVAEFGHGKSGNGSPQFNREDANHNTVVPLNSTLVMANQAHSHQLRMSSSNDTWKHIDPSIKSKGSGDHGMCHPHSDDRHSNSELSSNNRLDNGAYGGQNTNRKESTVFSHHTSTSGVRENAWSDSREKPMSSSKPSGFRKFQYHPMGDVTVDVPFGAKHATHSPSIDLQVSQGLTGHDLGNVGVSKSPSHMARNASETEKGQTDVVRSKSTLSSSAAASDEVVHHNAANKTITSQNMLELLHKLDQSRDRGSVMQLSSSTHNQSSEHEVSEAETSDGSVPPQQNQSAASQGFGLRLAPPSQQSTASDHVLGGHGPSQGVISLRSTHTTVDKGEKAHARNNIAGASGLSRTNTQGNFAVALPSGYPYSRSHLQNQHVTDVGGKSTSSKPASVSFGRLTPQSKQVNELFAGAKTNQLESRSEASQNGLTSANDMFQPGIYNLDSARDSTQQSPFLEAAPESQNHGMPQEDSAKDMSPPMVWNSISTQQHPVGAQSFKTPSTNLKPNFQQNYISDRVLLEDKNTQMGARGPPQSGACSVNPNGFAGTEQPEKGSSLLRVSSRNELFDKATGALQGTDVGCHAAAASFLNPASTQKELEAFGRNLRPNNSLHQNYSLLHPVHEVNGIEVAGNDFLRSKGCDSAVDRQLENTESVHQFVGQSSMVKDALTKYSTVPAGDAGMQSFSANPIDDGDRNAPSQDMLELGQNGASSSCRGEHSQISLRMAPSWFEQYGTFKTGQTLAMHDSRETTGMMTEELPSNIGRSSATIHATSKVEQVNYVAADASQCDVSLENSIPTSLSNETPSTSHLLHPYTAARLKKRRRGIPELVPWHKELIQAHPRLQDIREAETEWAMAANRLTEKVRGEAEMLEDGLPVHRSKRRLILTTQLMQQLVDPPLASILSANAFSHYDSATYSVARSTVGDACSSISCSASETPVSFNDENILPEKLQSSRRGSDMSGIMEDLISKARKVEKDLLRLDGRVSILDLRVECQDLEKFSVINRFAKFHGRGAESESSMSAQKPCPQRYVTALNMPRNVPDEVQCLSL